MTTTAQEWEHRASILHSRLFNLAALSPRVDHEGRPGHTWTGAREDVLRELWPNAQGQSRTHPYGGTLSRKLAGSVVKVGTDDDGRSVWWIALDRTAAPRDPRQCPTCQERFRSVEARRGHQASHGAGLRAARQAERLEALADTLAPLIADRLVALGAIITTTPTGGTP